MGDQVLKEYMIKGFPLNDEVLKMLDRVIDNQRDYEYPVSPRVISKEMLNEALTYYEQRDGFGYQDGLKPIFDKINLMNSISF